MALTKHHHHRLPRSTSLHHFFLSPQDRPRDFITPACLVSKNYNDWAEEIETALRARRKLSLLDETITKPNPPCTQADWTALHARLVSWIMNTIDPKVKCTLAKYKDAKHWWDTLKKRFALVNGPRIQQLITSLAKYAQTKSMSVASYIGKFTALYGRNFIIMNLLFLALVALCVPRVKNMKKREQVICCMIF